MIDIMIDCMDCATAWWWWWASGCVGALLMGSVDLLNRGG